jgi:ubiquitin thioesterase OTU1
MAGTPLVLRVRSKKGMSRLHSLNLNSSLKDLKTQITDLTGIEYSNIKIMKGYPPTVLENSNENASLQSLSLKDGELLTIEEHSDKHHSTAEQTSKSSKALSEKINTTNVASKSSSASLSPSKISQTSNQEGVLLRKVVPANNSCLFTSIYFVMENGLLNLDCQKTMREMIAKSVNSFLSYLIP